MGLRIVLPNGDVPFATSGDSLDYVRTNTYALKWLTPGARIVTTEGSTVYTVPTDGSKGVTIIPDPVYVLPAGREAALKATVGTTDKTTPDTAGEPFFCPCRVRRLIGAAVLILGVYLIIRGLRK